MHCMWACLLASHPLFTKGQAVTALAHHEEGEPPGDPYSAADNLNNQTGVAHGSKMPTVWTLTGPSRAIYCDKACKQGRWYTFWEGRYGSGSGYYGPCAPRPATTPPPKPPKRATTPGGGGKKEFDPSRPITGYTEEGEPYEKKPPPKEKEPEEKEPEEERGADPSEPKEPEADTPPKTTAPPAPPSSAATGGIGESSEGSSGRRTYSGRLQARTVRTGTRRRHQSRLGPRESDPGHTS
jgi:hypothetical protein